MTIVALYCHAIAITAGIHRQHMMIEDIIAFVFLLTRNHSMKLIIPVLLFMVVIWFQFTQDRFHASKLKSCDMTHVVLVLSLILCDQT